MIMARKKRRMVIGLTILFLLIIILAILLTLYFTTDMFKSNKTLFEKYLLQGMAQISNLDDETHMNELNQLLENNKEQNVLKGNITYEENGQKDNVINNINLEITGQTDKKENYNYQDISLTDENEQTLYKAEYINDNNIYGLRLEGIKQFVSTDLEKSTDENNKAKIWKDLKNINIEDYLGFSEEEKQILQTRYFNIINNATNENSFTKQKNVTLIINEQNYTANAYIFSLTKEELNNIYIEILNQIKTDDIILKKLENLDNKINEYNDIMQNGKTSKIKEEIVNKITEKTEEIKNSNIGSDQRRIIVYERQGKPISLGIENGESKIYINTIDEENKKFFEIEETKETEKENSSDFIIEKNIQENNEQIIVTYNKVVDDEKIENTLDYTRKLENDTVNVDFKLNRKIKDFNIEVNLNNVIKIVNNLDKIELDETNNVLLEDLDEDNKNNILNILNENKNSQQNRINEKIAQETFDNILINLELKQAGAEEIGNDGTISETERNRFNSNFEFYEGEKVSKENVLKLIEVAKNNLDDIKVTKYKEDEYIDEERTQPAVQEYSMLIKRSSKNDEVANKFYNTIKDSDKDSYNIKIEYNQQTGLVESILISVND